MPAARGVDRLEGCSGVPLVSRAEAELRHELKGARPNDPIQPAKMG